MPQVTGVLETALHVENVARAARFYEDLFGFEKLFEDERACAFNVGGRNVLLLFKRGGTLRPVRFPGGVIPPHDGTGHLHFAFSIPASELGPWENRLQEEGIPIESKVCWELGGESIYFRDLDHHLVELATPGTWTIY
jgi:catechol 2,3-dioxygenase-like lactoylglutathione lyase family enzyme